MLRSGQKFSELGVPEGDTLTLYVCHHDSIVTRRGCVMHGTSLAASRDAGTYTEGPCTSAGPRKD